MRQPLLQGRWQFGLLEAGGAQTVITDDLPRRLADSDKHLRHAPPYILRSLTLKVDIEGRFPAREGCTVMVQAKRLDDQGRLIHRHARDSGGRLSSASRSVRAG